MPPLNKGVSVYYWSDTPKAVGAFEEFPRRCPDCPYSERSSNTGDFSNPKGIM